MKVSCKNIPTYDYDTKEWSTTSFPNQLALGNFLEEKCFKEPGEYKFDERVFEWNIPAKTWTEKGRYTDYARGTFEYNEYWDNEELKCRLGVIWKAKDVVWYTPRDYYFLINYCPIVNKEKDYTETFADVRDGQYHMMLYEKIAEIFHQHSCELKRRQFLYSFCHVAKTVNYLWFENKKRLKWFASDDSYLDDVNGSWSILTQYKTHLNNHTDWYKEFSPDGAGEMQQKQKVKRNGKWEWEGNHSSLIARTLGKDPKKGVGGPTYYAWYEEGGIAPTADRTLQFMEPAMVSGVSRVGSFSIGGSVGDLSECKPLENFIKEPGKYGFYKVPTRWFDDSGTIHECGLFIPAQYGMPEATDEFGNSQIEKALALLHKAEFEGFKAGEYGKIKDEEPWINLPTEDYILKKSQSPKTIKEAFDWRKAPYFNAQRIERRQKSLKIIHEEGSLEEYKGLLELTREGKIRLKPLSEFPEHDRPTPMEYPVNPKILDKRGCCYIWEMPEEDCDSGTYFAGVDSIETGITETSNSLFSIHIYKRGVKKIHINSKGEQEISFERGKIVAAYCGRFKNPNDHNEQGLLLLRMFKALAACERNRPNFINYCRSKGYSYLIAKRSELPFDKDLDVTGSRNDEYGIYAGNDGKLLDREKKTMYEYIDAEIDTIHKKTSEDTDSIGEIVKTVRGYDLINDYWLLEELKLWNEDNNSDRFVSAALAIILGVSREIDHDKTVYSQDKQERVKPTQKYIPPSLLSWSRTQKIKNLLKY